MCQSKIFLYEKRFLKHLYENFSCIMKDDSIVFKDLKSKRIQENTHAARKPVPKVVCEVCWMED